MNIFKIFKKSLIDRSNSAQYLFITFELTLNQNHYEKNICNGSTRVVRLNGFYFL